MDRKTDRIYLCSESYHRNGVGDLVGAGVGDLVGAAVVGEAVFEIRSKNR